MSEDNIRRALNEEVKADSAKPFSWLLGPEAEESLSALEAERINAKQPVILSRSQIERVAARFKEQDESSFRQASENARLQVSFDEFGYNLGLENEPAADAIMAVVYQMIVSRGARARVTADDEEKLVAQGYAPADIDIIRLTVREVAASERRETWRLGPTREELAKALIADGFFPAFDTMHAVRRLVLLSRASLLRQLANRSRASDRGSMSDLTSTGDAALPVAPVTAGATAPLTEPLATEIPQAQPRLETKDNAVSQAVSVPRGIETAESRHPTFLELADAFIENRAKDLVEKTKAQYRTIAKDFVKFAGTNDPTRMSQADIGNYFDTLNKLPKSYRKSPADKDRAIEEIIARGEAEVKKSGRPADELIGRDPPTINRHVTQLGALLKYMKGKGYPIGDLTTLPDMRRRDPEPTQEKRRPFTTDDEITLFASAPWTGCASEKDRTIPGPMIIHDSLFFGPLLSKYLLLSKVEVFGIMLDDVDDRAAIPSIEIRGNEARPRVKTKTRTRRQAIHPELIRLGFIEYVQRLRSLGYRILFPDLRLRGDKTPLTDLFDKCWAPVLDAALPNARAQAKTFQSFRKTGNTILTAHPLVKAEVRLQLMGHQHKDVNGKHYIGAFEDTTKFDAVGHIPVTTSHVQYRKITLAKVVLESALKRDRLAVRII